MQVITDLFNLILIGPILNLLVGFMHFFQIIGVPGALGLAIIALTLTIRLLIWPFFSSQIRSAKKMAELKPHLEQLKNKHKDNKQALTQAQLALYKEHGVNPAGGCLPALIQLPIFIALYQAITAFFNGQAGLDHINSLLYIPSWYINNPPDPYFLGLNISLKPADFSQLGAVALLVPLISAALTFIQSKMMMPNPVKKYPSDSTQERQEKKETEDAMAAVQSQMIYLMPVMIGYFSFQFPLALSLYWNTLTLLGITQQYLVAGWGGMEGVLKRLPLQKS